MMVTPPLGEHPRLEDWQHFLRGALAESDLLRLVRHLQSCPACRQSLPTHVGNAPEVAVLGQLRRVLFQMGENPGGQALPLVEKNPCASGQQLEATLDAKPYPSGQTGFGSDVAGGLVREILLRWDALRKQGQHVLVAELVGTNREVAGEVQRRIDALQEMEWLLQLPEQAPEAAPLTVTLPPRGPGVALSPDERTGTYPRSDQTGSWTGLPPQLAGHKRPTIAGYEILSELGRGGVGVVYWVWQAALNRTAALKMLLIGAHAGEKELARFRTEVEAAARLQHPNIVQVYNVGEQDGRPYLVLEYVDGGNLAKKLEKNPLSAHQAAQWAEILARTMHFAHQRGVVHRDLKPANILLTADEVPKITDFGLAKLVVGGRQGHTQTGEVMGTPAYMAPEQAAGKTREVGPFTDVYALGALLYHMLTGLPPFQGTSFLDTLEQVQEHEPVPPNRLQPKVPRDLETICLTCLQKEPRKRYASAEALAEDLHRFLNGEPVHARRAPAWERVWKWTKRRPAAAALVGVSGLAVLTLLVASLWFNAYLRTALEQARAEEHHRARLAQQQESEQLRLQKLRDEAQKLVLAGQTAAARQDWSEAKLQFARAQAQLGSEGALADLTAHVDRLLTKADAELSARVQYQRFRELRDKALYHGTLFTGMDLPADLKVTRVAAWQALGLFGLTEDAGTALTFPDYFLNDKERAEVTVGCYELFLLLAEAVAHPLPTQTSAERSGGAREALGLLDRAKQLGLTTQAYHRRRGEYLDQLGDEAGAAAERRQAQLLPPTSPSDHFLVGDQFYKAGNVTAALEHFDRTLRLDPDHFWAQYFVAVCQLKLGRPKEAVADYPLITYVFGFTGRSQLDQAFN
ncbi:MAG: protein kinase, partial [Gemmataceae bacterium]|nr:protein kinase [Gemmataceae bacterium]